MIRALIFDFDGLILDTEWPDYESWQEVYRNFGCELPVEVWGQIVGGDGASDFDPYTYLAQLSGKPVDREEIWVSRRQKYLDNISELEVLPGVVEILDAAEDMGLLLAVASSSPENWVRGHLARLGLYERFDAIKTADDVKRTKPDPELYNAAMAALNVKPEEAIVFEDSPNGVLAANTAGVFAVAVPNRITEQLKLEHANLRLKSLADMPLAELIAHVEATRAGSL
ncbi:MAG TPA: HAD family hydrolase [Anaerolineales bacterium]|nr:HAD family hydrolase [Anaerolineales bacterium]HRQ92315.1 HAD family hydrolase [Anaerolineales bacterium]